MPMTDDLSEYLDEAEDLGASRKSMTDLAFALLSLEGELAALERAAKAKAEEVRRVREVELPEAMVAARTLDTTLINGYRIKLEQKLLSWGIPKTPVDRNDEAITWFEESGNEDLLKNLVTIEMGAGDDALASAVIEHILAGPGGNSLVITRKKSVHHQTLGKFIRDERAAGRGGALPEELLGVYVRSVATVVPPKKIPTPF